MEYQKYVFIHETFGSAGKRSKSGQTWSGLRFPRLLPGEFPGCSTEMGEPGRVWQSSWVKMTELGELGGQGGQSLCCRSESCTEGSADVRGPSWPRDSLISATALDNHHSFLSFLSWVEDSHSAPAFTQWAQHWPPSRDTGLLPSQLWSSGCPYWLLAQSLRVLLPFPLIAVFLFPVWPAGL